MFLVLGVLALLFSMQAHGEELLFPPPGESVERQSRWTPEQAGFDPRVMQALAEANVAQRWALWRYGHLIHSSPAEKRFCLRYLDPQEE